MEQWFSSAERMVLRNTAPHRFGFGFSHPDCDFAGVLPLSNHAFMVDLFEEIEATVKLAKWWKDEEALADKVK